MRKITYTFGHTQKNENVMGKKYAWPWKEERNTQTRFLKLEGGAEEDLCDWRQCLCVC